MSKAGVTHDLTIASGGTTIGFMLLRDRTGRRRYRIHDFQTLQPRTLSMGELTQAEFNASVDLNWFQDTWQAGLGGINQRTDPNRLASSLKIDATTKIGLRLARDVLAATVDVNPTEYVPSGFAVSGGPWAFIGRTLYEWDYTNKNWDTKQTPFAAATLYRNGVPFETNVYAPRWADDVGSGGSYVVADEPCSYIHRTLNLDVGDATTWTTVDGTGSTNPDACKYMAVADGKLWGGYWIVGADTTEDTADIAYDAASSGSTAGASSLTVSHTVSASVGLDRCLLVGVTTYDSPGGGEEPTGVTYGGVAMTLVGSSVTQGLGRLSVWRLINPATGANNIVVTCATVQDAIALGGLSFSGVHSGTPLGTSASATGTSTLPSVAVTSIADDIVVDFHCTVDGVTNSAQGAGETERFEVDQGATITLVGQTEIATGASTTMAPTLADSLQWIIIGVAVKRAGVDTTTDTSVGTTATPSANISAGDVVRIDSELMLVSAVSDSPPSLTVVRGYRGSVAATHSPLVSIYEMNRSVHHVRSSTGPTALSNWSSATTIGDSSAAITALVGVGTDLIIIKQNGVFRLATGGAVTNLRPELESIRHPDFGKGAFAWNDTVYIPTGTGGILELETTDWTITPYDIVKQAMTELTQFQGKVVAGTGEPDGLYILVHESGNTRFHLLHARKITISGTTDYRWHHLGMMSYTTGTDANHANLFFDGTPSGSTIHHRVLIGVESTGSNLVGSYLPLVDDAEVVYTNDTDAEAVTVKWDKNLAKITARFDEIVCNTKNLGSGGTDHNIEVQYRVDGGSWTYITGTQSTSTLTSNSQTIAFAASITGKILELKFLPKRGSTTSTSPELLDFTVRAQLRPSALKTLPLQLYLADDTPLLNGAMGGRPKIELAQLETWNAQAAELTVVDARSTSRTMLFLPGFMRVEEVGIPQDGRPAYIVSVLLAEV